MIAETSSGTTRSYVFKNDSLSMDAEQMQENINADGETRIALGEGKQQEIKGKLEEETMLAENIVKDHHSIMMIGTVEITREAIAAVNKEEGLNSHQRINEWEKELELLEKWLKAPVGKK